MSGNLGLIVIGIVVGYLLGETKNSGWLRENHLLVAAVVCLLVAILLFMVLVESG